MADGNYTPQMAAAPPTAAILSTHERIEIEALGIEVLIPQAYARMLRRTGQNLKLDVQLDPEPSPLPPLTSEQQSVLSYLREHGVTSAEVLSKHAGYSIKTIHRWAAGKLAPYGVIPTPDGYGLSTK